MHVLGIGEGPDGLRLVAADDAGSGRGAPAHIPLRPGEPFAWRVTGPRTCVGRWEPDPESPDAPWRHVACPTQAPVGSDFVCVPCSGLERPQCVFEPQCALDPAGCRCAAFRGVPHLVYLAFHGTLPKVGMTQAWRVRQRLREQGADAWFAIQAHPIGEPTRALDRAAARAIERQVAFLYGIPEWRAYHETLPQLARPVAWDAIATKAEQWRERLATRYEPETVVHRIEDHPVVQPVPAVPVRLAPEGTHRGTWLGAKGNHVFFVRRQAGLLSVGEPAVGALKRSELLGRRLDLA